MHSVRLVGKMYTAVRRGSTDGRSGHPPSESLVDFSASVVVLQGDRYSVVLAFGDHPVEPEHSVVLSFTQQPLPKIDVDESASHRS